MAFQRPLLKELLARAQADIETRLPAADLMLPGSLLSVIAKMNGGMSHELYGALDWLSDNLLPDTTDPDLLGRWAGIYGVARLQPQRAQGKITFTGAGTVPAGTQLKSSIGQIYEMQADATLPDLGEVQAVDAGAQGNLPEGAALTLVSPVAGVQSSAVVSSSTLAGGADIETIDAWSARLVQRIQQPPQGGSSSDYERWAREASAAVTHAWVTAHEGGSVGVVTVRIATFGASDGDLPGNTSPLLQTVYDYIDARRPVAGVLQVFAPVPQPVNLTLAIKPDSLAVKTAAEAALAELFQREARPGAFVPEQGELLGAIPLTHVHEALSGVDGETDHQIQAIGSLAPASAGHMLTLGTITWSGWQS